MKPFFYSNHLWSRADPRNGKNDFFIIDRAQRFHKSEIRILKSQIITHEVNRIKMR
ncbi:hypothetical protein D1AOALGA4SA_9131 [Olavius algarvensis Delta 1 endosymbiont]|nr:hypothetical protein D1AOALGA4SA_9131 [Olavius algarvensis Delta 1 endosymbiont]